MKLFNLITWLIAGVLVLSVGKITRIEYGLCWGALIINILADML
jgi:hypothetical protein